jgi:lipid-binding SYLF domain-containing protein
MPVCESFKRSKMPEILHVPNNIPQDLLDKARCVVVMPSVLKAAL